jgi:hypothetical protein
MNHPLGAIACGFAAASLAGAAPRVFLAGKEPSPRVVKPKSVAAIITVYRAGSHADVLIGKILEGWQQDGGPGPSLKLASMYVDQFPPEDVALLMSRKHEVPIFDSIEKGAHAGRRSPGGGGVISIRASTADYPWNDKEQHLYPRRRFFEQITATFEKHERVVRGYSTTSIWGRPGPTRSGCNDRARELKIPFMAGSSLPLSFRSPEIDVPPGSEIEAALGLGYDGLDIYGSHALDCYQSLVERRPRPRRASKSVQCLQGAAVWKANCRGRRVPRGSSMPPWRSCPRLRAKILTKDDEATLFLFEYVDGFRGAQLMLTSISRTAVALKIKGKPQPLATSFEERTEPHYPHFAYLLKAIERMMHTGRPSYPVEHVLLTSGILDRALESRAQGGRKLDTPELMIRYSRSIIRTHLIPICSRRLRRRSSSMSMPLPLFPTTVIGSMPRRSTSRTCCGPACGPIRPTPSGSGGWTMPSASSSGCRNMRASTSFRRRMAARERTSMSSRRSRMASSGSSGTNSRITRSSRSGSRRAGRA